MKTKDPVNQGLIEHEINSGFEKIGLMNSKVWSEDPKRLIFTLSRYKFVSKMFNGIDSVLEIGCGDGFGSKVVNQTVKNLTISDYDPLFIERFNSDLNTKSDIKAVTHDFLEKEFSESFDAIYSLDVLEHIHPEKEDLFISNCVKSLKKDGVLIFGMPSLESQLYASQESKEGHVNCKSGNDFKECMEKYFKNVFLFSMNDEVIHTGFEKMAHYLFTLCVGKI